MDEYETQDLDEEIESIQLRDMHITNRQESAIVPSLGVSFQLYEVFGEPRMRKEKLEPKASRSRESRPCVSVLGNVDLKGKKLVPTATWGFM